MPKYHVKRSILINSPMETIRNVLLNFHQWIPWSPWLISEPDAKLSYSESQGTPGSYYSWNGKLVGKGKMTLTAIDEQKLEMQLNLLSPFKTQSQVWFDLLPEKHGTRVVWNMHGKLPFFLFFMLKTMKSWIGMDYQRGLAMLKEYIETGMVLSRVEIIGKTTLTPTPYIGISGICALEDLGKIMPPLFQKLGEFAKTQQLASNSPPFSIYNHINMYTQKVDYTCATPVPKDTPVTDDLEYGELPALPVLQVNHTGRYENLGNAWSSAAAYARANKIKLRKSPKGFEYYPDDPAEIELKDLKTIVYLPLR